MLDKNHECYNAELEDIIVNFLTLRVKYLETTTEEFVNKLHQQKELFLIYDALKNEGNLDLLMNNIISKDFNFINNQRYYSKNSDALHRNTMNKSFKKYWNSMLSWNNTVEEKMEVFSKVYGEMKTNSASLKLSNINDWDSYAFSYIPQLLKSNSRLEFYEVLIQMVNRIGDNHNCLSVPYDISLLYTNPQINILFIDNSFYIKSKYIISNETINAGDEIIKIEGLETKEYLKVNQNKYPFVEYYHFKPELSAFYNLCNVLLTYPKDKSLEIKLKRKDNSTYNITFSDSTKYKTLEDSESDKVLECAILENKNLYIEIKKFWGSDIYQDFIDNISKYNFDEIKGLIIDVRKNTGGLSVYGDKIFGHFINESAKNYQFDYSKVNSPHFAIEGVDDIKANDFSVITPNKEYIIDCPTAILTSPYSGSATEDFVFLFKYYKRGKVIGLPTSGSTGNALNILLKGGGYLRVNLDVSLNFSCKGIYPDIFVDYSISDLLNGNDSQLKIAINYLNGYK